MTNFFCNRSVDKRELKRLIAWFLATRGSIQTTKMVDDLKGLGFHYATHAGISIGIEDLQIPPAKNILLAYANKEINQNEKRFFRGKISAVERSQNVIDIWNATSELIKEEIVEYFEQTDLLNPVYMMAFSGARGNLSQVRQLVGMRGLMSDPQGEIIDLPIKSNFREGLTVTEYIISCYGARKGLVDTALKTANSGYLTRRLVDVAQALIINEIDCGTKKGISLDDLYAGDQIVFPLEKRLIGRVLLNPLRIKTRTIPNYDLAISAKKESKKLVIHSFTPKNRDICQSLSNELMQIYPEVQIRVRSPLTCKTVQHSCKLCYGWSLAQGKMVDLGEAIGIIAAQSIGEPGTQLTMRTFHTGGVFSTEVGKRIYSPHEGILSFSLKDAQKIRTEFGQQGVYFAYEIDITIEKPSKEKTLITVPRFSVILFKPGTKIYWKQVIAEISTLPKIYGKFRIRKSLLTRKEVFATETGNILGQRRSERFKLMLKSMNKCALIRKSAKKPLKVAKLQINTQKRLHRRQSKRSSFFLLQSITKPIPPREFIYLPKEKGEKEPTRIEIHKIRFYKGDFVTPSYKQVIKKEQTKVDSFQAQYPKKYPNQFKTTINSFILFKGRRLLVLGLKSKEFITSQFFTELDSIDRFAYEKQIPKKLKDLGPSIVKTRRFNVKDKPKNRHHFIKSNKLKYISPNPKLFRVTKTEHYKIPRPAGPTPFIINRDHPLTYMVQLAPPPKELKDELKKPIKFILYKKKTFKSHRIGGSRFRGTNKSSFVPGYQYCQQSLKYLYPTGETFACWLYFPILRTIKQYKQLYTYHFSYANAYESLVDQIIFPEMVFTEQHNLGLGQFEFPIMISFRKLLQFPLVKHTLYRKSEEGEFLYRGPCLAKYKRRHELSPTEKFERRQQVRQRIRQLRQEYAKRSKFSIRTSKNQELIFRAEDKYCFIEREKHQKQLLFPSQSPLIGRLLVDGSTIQPGIISTSSGKVEQITRDGLILRNGLPYLCPLGSQRSKRTKNTAFVSPGTLLLTLFYRKSKSEDIVQGLPKVEQIFEGRRTKALQPILNNSHDRLVRNFERLKKWRRYSTERAAKESILRTQQYLVARVQRVYQSQGVDISDKHVEIITKQMTSRVFIEDGGLTSFLYGDLVEFYELETCCKLANQYNLTAPIYEPMVLGITKAALRTESFLSAASFQETTRVLTQASLQTKYDFFDGLKENVIIGRLIPAGTGFSAETSILSLGKAPTWKDIKEKAKKKEEAKKKQEAVST